MVPERWRQILELLEGALGQAPGDREAFLDERCASDTALRGQVEDLLEADKEAAGFMRDPLVPVHGAISLPTAAGSPGRDLVGPYRLLRRIGQGGMSTVYLAVRGDDEYHRRVAVKIVRQGVEGEERLHRFRTERQILASLDHPSIARLYDGGTTDQGTPYFVMEYVEGLPVDEYCDRYCLSVRERLELFRKVCSAVHYAHQNLVVHRDLKPSNILVNADGVPKLLDFGIAKLLNPELSFHPEPTATWVRMMTPHYASPEQVRGKMITTASDVYSLGVLLYELLTGHLPHLFNERSPQEIEQLLTEVEPARPSAVVGREEAASGTSRALGSQRHVCGMRPEQLRRRLSGDLDTIVLMALRQEPQRRYTSVQQFSEDVRRHLAGLPVMARKATPAYRIRKFLRRNRVATAG
ncbi:MAG: serine/threonine protein kinase, partial [bacterium]|nr:serine/threonine protein kinase [bacterium]